MAMVHANTKSCCMAAVPALLARSVRYPGLEVNLEHPTEGRRCWPMSGASGSWAKASRIQAQPHNCRTHSGSSRHRHRTAVIAACLASRERSGGPPRPVAAPVGVHGPACAPSPLGPACRRSARLRPGCGSRRRPLFAAWPCAGRRPSVPTGPGPAPAAIEA